MQFFTQLRTLAAPYWQSKEKLSAGLYLAIVLLLTASTVYIQIQINEWYNNFYTALQNYESDRLIHLIYVFTGLAFAYILIAVYAFYLRQLLGLKWRTWLTHYYLGRWLGHKHYYYMQYFGAATDNPDQRISEDIKLFVGYFLTFTVGVVKSLLTLAAFFFILWNLSDSLTFPVLGITVTIPHYLVWAAFIYAILGTTATHLVGRRLTKLRYTQQKFEADFRFSLIRTRENSQSIAFYGGEGSEEKSLHKRFQSLIENFIHIIKKEKQLVWLNSSYSQIAIIFPLVVTLPAYLTRRLSLGGLMQTTSAFGTYRTPFPILLICTPTSPNGGQL